MAYSKELVVKVMEALANTEKDKCFYFDKENKAVIEVSDNIPDCKLSEIELVKIEAMLKDFAELMEDFALEQEAEDVQDSLLKMLQNRDRRIGIINFKRILHDFPRSKKRWNLLENKWLKERALEFLDDLFME